MPRFVLVLALLAPACALAQSESEVAPRLESIPTLAAHFSGAVAEILSEARGALSLRLPRLSPRADSRKAADWAERRFAPWVTDRARAMSATERAAYSLYLGAGREGALAAAIVAVVYEDFVRVATRVPVPHDLARDPDLRAAYLGAFREAFAPTASVAENAYERCRSTATGAGESALAAFCEARARAVRESFSVPSP
ncbi:MAG: hypothetical protein K8H88_15550 [Sandaracinaceae bacterium]|nr:hypothetical protein [Sandaracinaceae bacterium]